VGVFAKLKQLFGGKPSAGGSGKPSAGGGSASGSGAKPAKAAKKKKKDLPRIRISSRFELLGHLGQGSMSKVHRARDLKLGRMVCLKILDKEKTSKFEARWIGMNKPPEGEILSELTHPNIVKTYEYGLTSNGEPFIVMELVDGPGLNFLIETNSDKLKGRRVELLVQAADALDFIHRRGYLHRDICPRNMMVSSDGTLKYIDFGLAIPNRPEFTKAGNRTGTPSYLAPELIKRVATDHRVDLYALGVTAYEMFTGHLPWESLDSQQVLMSHMNDPGRNPREFRPDLDDEVVALLKKAIEREPRNRYQSAAQFRDALQGLPDAERW
jgi:serine/threonine protein kinase